MNDQYRHAIGSVESDNDYAALGPVTDDGDRAYGRYQVMGANIPEWTKTHLGVEMTPKQFLADKGAQDKVFDAVTGRYYKKYGNLDDVTSSWFSGRPVAEAGNSSDGYNTTPQYLAKVNAAMSGNPVSAINAAAGIKPSAPGVLTSAFAKKDDDEEDTPATAAAAPALSADSTMGAGALSPQPKPNKASAIGQGLTGIGAALAGISNPQQGQALTQQMVAMQKTATDGGSWSLHTMPNGQVMRINSKTAQTQMVPGSYAKPEDDPYDKKIKEETAKNMADLDTNISSAARDAVNQQATVEELRRAFSNPGVKQGFLGEYGQTLRKAYASMGFGDPTAVADGDIANALSHKLALQLVNNGGTKLLPGSFSDSDRKFVEGMATSLNNSPDANQRLLDIYDRANKRVAEAETARQKHSDANGGFLKPSFRGELNLLSKKWTTEDKERQKSEASTPAKLALPPRVKSIQLITP